MAAVGRPMSSSVVSNPRDIPGRMAAIHLTEPSGATSLPPPQSSMTRSRNGHLNLDTFSPVNQNGSFAFDRVLKSGYVEKRTRKTKTWKRIYLVLRPNLLSIYKDQNEIKLRHKIHLSELTAVALLKDPKHRRQHVFGLFSPSRNYHLQAGSAKDAEEWLGLIRQEARIEEEEEEMLLASPGGQAVGTYVGFERQMQEVRAAREVAGVRHGTSSPEPGEVSQRATVKPRASTQLSSRRPSHTFDYSGNELASHSDMSDVEQIINRGASTLSVAIPEEVGTNNLREQGRPDLGPRTASQASGFNIDHDPERVVWQGFMLYLKSSKGVKQWRQVWAVLRLKSLALYKDEHEYSPRLIVSVSSIINAVEIDPLSRTKIHCMQIITEEKSYKFSAHSEEALDKALGALKSLLARRKDHEARRLGQR